MAVTYNQRVWTVWTFLVCGVVVLVGGIVMLTLRLIALQHWSVVQGTVLESVLMGPDEEGIFTATVTVRWKFKDSEYSKKFGNWGSGGQKEFERIVARYPPGSATPILCDPANPASAYLEAGYRPGFFFVPGLLIALGLLFSVLGYFLRRWLL